MVGPELERLFHGHGSVGERPARRVQRAVRLVLAIELDDQLCIAGSTEAVFYFLTYSPEAITDAFAVFYYRM